MAFFAGYPAAFFLFYVARALWSVVPAQVKSIKWTVLMHAFFFVVIVAVLEPLCGGRRIYFSFNAAFLVQIIIYTYPVGFASLWGFVCQLSGQRIWSWLSALRFDMQVLTWLTRSVERWSSCLRCSPPTSWITGQP